jgi:hypothetical protein
VRPYNGSRYQGQSLLSKISFSLSDEAMDVSRKAFKRKGAKDGGGRKDQEERRFRKRLSANCMSFSAFFARSSRLCVQRQLLKNGATSILRWQRFLLTSGFLLQHWYFLDLFWDSNEANHKYMKDTEIRFR